MIDAYFHDYLADFPWLNSAAWGYTIDTSNQVLRLILSGLFESFPKLSICLGHMGEGLPFLVDVLPQPRRSCARCSNGNARRLLKF